MDDFFLKILDWSEVWALLIPLTALLFRREQPATSKPIIVYIWVAFILNLAIDIIMELRTYYPDWTNNPLYNIHSVVRFTCFSFYFIKLQPRSFTSFKKMLAIASVLFLVLNFSFYENFFRIPVI